MTEDIIRQGIHITDDFPDEFVDELVDTITDYTDYFSKINFSNINLIGPTSLTTHFSKNNPKRIMILGDIHDIKERCIDEDKPKIQVEDYLRYVFDSHPSENFDMFLEYWYKEPEPVECHLENVIDTFKNNREYFDVPNLRVHYGDIRNMEDTLLNKYTNTTWMILYGGNKDIDPIETFKASSLPYPITMEVIEEIIEETKINKQLQHIIDQEIASKIREYFIDIFKDKLQEAEEKEIDKVWKIDYIITHIVDMYIISRMFRSFSDYNSRNCIIYCGEAHANNIRKFLHEVLNFQYLDKLFSNYRESFQCISIDMLTDIFSFEPEDEDDTWRETF